MSELKFSCEKYNSIGEYIKTITSRENSNAMRGIFTSVTGEESFSGTRTWEQSINLLERGYEDGLLNIMSSDLKIWAKGTRAVSVPSVVGYAPIVPNAIMGLPTSMLQKTQINQKTKIVNILYNPSCHYKVRAEELFNAGRKIYRLVNDLEMNGCRVNLWTCFGAKGKKQCCVLSVKVKTDRQPMNPLKLAYPIVHPSWFRRQFLKWLETFPKLEDDSFRKGYGTALHNVYESDRIKSELKKTGILNDGDFYINFEDASKTEYDAFREKIIKEIFVR